MPEEASGATASWAGDVATVTVRGGLAPDSAPEVRQRIAEVAARRPARLVLDLSRVSEREGAECLAMVAVARHLLPPGCALDVRSENPAVRQILSIASLSVVQESAGSEKPEAV